VKICKKCNILKHLIEYSKSVSHKDGYLGCCRACKKIYKKQWAIDNKENIAIKQNSTIVKNLIKEYYEFV